MEAPIVVAKGDGYLAQEILYQAEHGMIIAESTLLAQMLYDQCNIGQAIPENMCPEMDDMLAELCVVKDVVDHCTDALENQLNPQQSSYARTRRRRSSRSSIRISLD
jgi:flagellar biosynthesis protein FlhB